MFRPFLFLFAGIALSAAADTILLGNGDRLTGTITGVAEGRLHIDTDYAGTIAIELGHVSIVEAATPRTLRLEDGRLLTGALHADGEAQILVTESGEQVLQWPQVTALGEDTDSVQAVEIARLEADEPEVPKRWSGTADAGMTLRSGQVDTVDANLKVTATRIHDVDSLILTAEASYGEAESQVNVRRYFGQARYERHFRDRVFGYVLSDLEQDAARGLELRWGNAAGLGYDILQREKTTLSADAGLSYRIEWWKLLTLSQERQARSGQEAAIFNETRALLQGLRTTPLLSEAGAAAVLGYANRVQGLRVDNPVDRRDGAELRLAARFAQDILERGKLTNDLVSLPDLNELGEVRATNEVALSTPLSETLALRLSLKSEYDSMQSAVSGSEWNHTLLTGLRYAF